MNPPWRTQTVTQLCQAMRETRDYSVLPILADALQDADYTDEEILATMRSGPDKIEAQRLVALIYSAETAAAVKRIESIAATLGSGVILELGGEYVEGKDMSYSTLIDVANRWLDSEEMLKDAVIRTTFPNFSANTRADSECRGRESVNLN